MKLSEKQKEVIREMRKGYVIYWLGGLNPHCFLSSSFTFKVSTATCLRLDELKLIERTDKAALNDKYILTELGKTIEL